MRQLAVQYIKMVLFYLKWYRIFVYIWFNLCIFSRFIFEDAYKQHITISFKTC